MYAPLMTAYSMYSTGLKIVYIKEYKPQIQ